MRDRFRLTPGGRHPHEPWFHIGSLGVTTSWLVVLVSVVGLLLFAALGSDGIMTSLVLVHPNVVALKLWTVLTWPIAYPTVSFWDVLSIFFLWYFGSDIERNELGRSRYAWLLGAFTLAIGLLTVGFGELLDPSYLMYSLNMLQMMVLLLWIAQWPDRMFFFNIPAWVFGLVIVGIQLIQYLGTRSWVLLIVFVAGAVVCALIARQFGMLDRYPWIPRLVGVRPPRPARAPKPRKQRSSGPAETGGNVVAGPWTSAPQPPPSRDEQRMDELLDKIHASGTESLSDAEKAELLELRERRRRRS